MHFRSTLPALVFAAALAACSGLPPRPERPPTHAYTDTAGTALARIERASLVAATGGESGFRLLQEGEFAIDARLALVRRAERSIDAQYYQVQADGTGLAFLGALRDAALRGVRVRLLVDDLYAGGEDELFATLAATPGVEVRLFNPLPSRSKAFVTRVLLSLNEFGRINHRMHNKLLVADNAFAIAGGRNIADEYFMRSTSANFIDMDVLSAGPIVREQSAVFDRYWNSPYAFPVETIAHLLYERPAAQRRFDEIVERAATIAAPHAPDGLGGLPLSAELAAGRATLVPASARVLADAPEKIIEHRRDPEASTVTHSVLAVFGAARSEVTIASPYFIPGPVGMASMQEAIAHRVTVSVFTNSLGATDEPLVHWRYARYRRDMLRLGVHIQELSPDLARSSGGFGDFGRSSGRLHAKVAVVDRRFVFVGSMNLDARSAWSNTEAGLLIDSPPLARGIHALVDRDRNESVYRLRLRPDRETIEWVSTDAQGRETVTDDEPHGSWLLRLKMWLLEPLTSEDLF